MLKTTWKSDAGTRETHQKRVFVTVDQRPQPNWILHSSDFKESQTWDRVHCMLHIRWEPWTELELKGFAIHLIRINVMESFWNFIFACSIQFASLLKPLTAQAMSLNDSTASCEKRHSDGDESGALLERLRNQGVRCFSVASCWHVQFGLHHFWSLSPRKQCHWSIALLRLGNGAQTLTSQGLCLKDWEIKGWDAFQHWH